MIRPLFVLFVGCFSVGVGVTYRVTENPTACREIRIPKWTNPDKYGSISSWGCGYDIRTHAGAMYVGLSCGSASLSRAPEKYAINWSRPEEVRHISQADWEAGVVLEPHDYEGETVATGQKGVVYRDQLFSQSGSTLESVAFSGGGSRIAINSWSGTDRDGPEWLLYEGSMLSFLFQSLREKHKGRYWTDIYDTASAKRFLRIVGEFRGEKPHYFQGKAQWYGGRYYVFSLDPGGMTRLLICDANVAAKAAGVVEVDAPAPVERAKRPAIERDFWSQNRRKRRS